MKVGTGMRWYRRGSGSRRIALFAIALLFPGLVSYRAGIAGAGGAPTDAGIVAQATDERTPTMKIRMTINGNTSVARLDDTPAAADFASLLPLTVTLSDYHSIEKISDLPKRLSHDGAPSGYEPEVGDVAYYAPWGNLAIFYRDFGYARGLVRLGTIESGLDALTQSGPLATAIERIEP
ncbi:cyclophilin-like fold protein [Ancylobacter polymorphus]|uniref:Cyclophilin-like fold protein n=1 Tax=Ancylobacter polymorphus TaxID=223390 RepID=A0A9E6ZWY0_9HYPH|nr:cyclophilin-like fold protein [Ancylobacter polymorphus]UOK73286.1 cyclophilin-like fold protein [Ancylobacter polymorphus]